MSYLKEQILRFEKNTSSLTEKKTTNFKMGNEINSKNIPSSDTLFNIKA